MRGNNGLYLKEDAPFLAQPLFRTLTSKANMNTNKYQYQFFEGVQMIFTLNVVALFLLQAAIPRFFQPIANMNKNKRKQWFVFERKRTFSCSTIIPYVDIKSKHPKLSKYQNCISFDMREQLQKKITFNVFAVLKCQAAITLHFEHNKTMTKYE